MGSGSDRAEAEVHRLIIFDFDFDGTLADTWEWLADELIAAAEPLNYRRPSREELEGMRALETKEVFRRLRIRWWRIPRLATRLRRRAETRADELRLFDGISDLLGTLHERGFTLAIASSNSEAAVRRILGPSLTRLIDRFDCDASIFGKASKFKRLIRKLRATEATVIGDESRDIEAAEAAGAKGLAVEWGYASPALLRRIAPGRTATDIEDLKRLLAVEAEPVAAGNAGRTYAVGHVSR